MTDLMMTPVEETLADEDEGDIVHVICCATDSGDPKLTISLCGALINSDEPIDYSVDQDCDLCLILSNSYVCPLFGQCNQD